MSRTHFVVVLWADFASAAQALELRQVRVSAIPDGFIEVHCIHVDLWFEVHAACIGDQHLRVCHANDEPKRFMGDFCCELHLLAR